jgi:hypothetical protein
MNRGLFLPFNVSVADEAGSTLIATTNHFATSASWGSIGVQILARELNRRMEQILMEFAVHDTAAMSSASLERTEEAV